MITISAELRRALPMLLVVLALSVAPCIQAQTPTPTPKSEEVQKLEEQKAQLDLRKGIAEDEKAIRDAKFPKPDTKALEGKTEINDNAVIESQMVAYVSMARAANKIINAIKATKIENLAIYNERDLNLLTSYKVSTHKIQLIRDGYCSLLAPETITKLKLDNICPSPPSGEMRELSINPLSIANSFLGAFVDLTALLRTNVQIKGQTFDIDEAPLVAEVFRAARRSDGLGKDVKLYYPLVIAPNVDPRQKSEILGILEKVNLLRVEAGALLSDIQKKSKDLAESDDNVKGLKKSIKDLKRQKEEAKDAAKRLLEAYCRALAHKKLKLLENEGLDDDEQQELELLEKLTMGCRRMPAEKRELALGLRDTIKGLRAKLNQVKSDLQDEDGTNTSLKKELIDLLMKLNADLQKPEELSSAIARLKAVNDQFDKFVNSLVDVDSGTGLNTLTSYIRAEQLKTALPEYAIPFQDEKKDSNNKAKEKKSYWLQLKVVKAGGNNRIKTNLLWDVFTGGSRVSHSGGAIVEYILYDAYGTSVASDTITEYTNYIKAGKVRDLPDDTIDDCGSVPCPPKKNRKEKN